VVAGRQWMLWWRFLMFVDFLCHAPKPYGNEMDFLF
jgi:hypothetical protein